MQKRGVGVCISMAIGFAGCMSGSDDPNYEVAEGRGIVCAASPNASAPFSECAVTFAADAPVELHVDFDLCLSSSCDTLGPSSCTATRNGSVITVSATGKWTHDTSGGGCTDDCRFLRTKCMIEPLPAGQYVIEYAGKSLPLEIPSTTTEHCMPHYSISACLN